MMQNKPNMSFQRLKIGKFLIWSSFDNNGKCTVCVSPAYEKYFENNVKIKINSLDNELITFSEKTKENIDTLVLMTKQFKAPINTPFIVLIYIDNEEIAELHLSF